MTMAYTVSPTPADASAILVDVDTSTVSIYTTDPNVGISGASTPVIYTVTIYQVTEGGTNQDSGGEQMYFSVTITEPCISETLVIDSTNSVFGPALT